MASLVHLELVFAVWGKGDVRNAHRQYDAILYIV